MSRLTAYNAQGRAEIIGAISYDILDRISDLQYERFSEALKKLAEYEDLEEQERLVKLPFAVGQTVWVVRFCESEVPGERDYITYDTKYSFAEYIRKETCYATHEEAEAALAAMEAESK